MSVYGQNIARLFLLEIQYQVSKGSAIDPGCVPPHTYVQEGQMVWKPSSVFESRGAACEYAFDRGYVDYRISEITMNPVAVKRDHLEILP